MQRKRRTIEQPAPVEQRERETEHVLELLLELVHGRPLLVRHLLVDLRSTHVRLPERNNGQSGRTSFSPKEKTGTRSALTRRAQRKIL